MDNRRGRRPGHPGRLDLAIRRVGSADEVDDLEVGLGREPVYLALGDEEVRGAYESVFNGPRGRLADDGAIARMVEHSSGQPYLVQLIGYHAYALAAGDERGVWSGEPLGVEEADLAFAAAYQRYRDLALRPILSEARPSGVAYLRAMVRVLDERHVASTAGIAAELRKTSSQLSKVRDRLLGQGVVIGAGHGLLRFGIPYLRKYLLEDHDSSDRLTLAESWDV